MSGVIGQIENSLYQFYIDQFLKTKRGLSINCLWFVFIDKPSENGLAYIADSAKNLSDGDDISQTTIYKEAVKYFTTGLGQGSVSIQDKPFFLANTVEVPGDKTQATSLPYEVTGGSGAITPKTVSTVREGTTDFSTQLYLNDFSFPNTIVRPWSRAVSIYGLKFQCLRTTMRCVQYTRQFQDGPWQPTLTIVYNGVFPIGCPQYSLNYQAADSTKTLNVLWGYDCYKMRLGNIDYNSNNDHGWDYTTADAEGQKNVSWLEINTNKDDSMAGEKYLPDDGHTNTLSTSEHAHDEPMAGVLYRPDTGHTVLNDVPQGDKMHGDEPIAGTEYKSEEKHTRVLPDVPDPHDDEPNAGKQYKPDKDHTNELVNEKGRENEDNPNGGITYIPDGKHTQLKKINAGKKANNDTAYIKKYGNVEDGKRTEIKTIPPEDRRNDDVTYHAKYGKVEDRTRTNELTNNALIEWLEHFDTPYSTKWFLGVGNLYTNFVPIETKAAKNSDTVWESKYGGEELNDKYQLLVYKSKIAAFIAKFDTPFITRLFLGVGNAYTNFVGTEKGDSVNEDTVYNEKYGKGVPEEYMVTTKKTFLDSLFEKYDTPFVTRLFLGVGNAYTNFVTTLGSGNNDDTVYADKYGGGVPDKYMVKMKLGLIGGLLNMFDTPYSTSLFLGYGNKYTILETVPEDDHLDSYLFRYRALLYSVPYYDHLDPTVFVYRALLYGVPYLDCLQDSFFEYRALLGRVPNNDHLGAGTFNTISMKRTVPRNDVATGDIDMLSRTVPKNDVPTGDMETLPRTVPKNDVPTGDFPTLPRVVPRNDVPTGDFDVLLRSVLVNDTPVGDMEVLFGSVPYNDTPDGTGPIILTTTPTDDAASGEGKSLSVTTPKNDIVEGDVRSLSSNVPTNDTTDGSSNILTGTVPKNDTADDGFDGSLRGSVDPNDTPVPSDGDVNILERGVDMNDFADGGNNFQIRNVSLLDTPRVNNDEDISRFQKVAEPRNDTPDGMRVEIKESKPTEHSTDGSSNKFYMER